MRIHLTILCLGILMWGCGSKKRVVTRKTKTETNKKVAVAKPHIDNVDPQLKAQPYLSTTENYILQYKDIAQKEMILYHIPASITLAQGILESASGRGRLAQEANNHFGIKCHKSWTGAKIYHDDDEKGECFRKYNKAKYSFRDHSLFLTSRKRYAALFNLKITHYKAWAKGLKAAGYATDRKYPLKLIGLIERYKLYNYDDEVLGRNPFERKISKKNGLVHIVVKGDTLYGLSRQYNVTVKELQRLNNIKGTNIALGQELKVR